MPRAIVISFGDELVSGQRVDTNSAWLSAKLLAIGLPVVMHLTAGDDLETCADVLRFAGRHADVVVTTGGLGPTADDLTRSSLATATGHELELDEKALAHIENIFARGGREMPQRNRVQAMFPRDSMVIPNPHGTAPGIDHTTIALGKRTRFIALPGVPAEAKEMWAETVESCLWDRHRTPELIRSYTLKCFGEGESAIEQRLGELMRRDQDPIVGITVHQATITLRVTAKGTTEKQCQSVATAAMDQIRARLGDLVFGEGDVELENVLIGALAERHFTLATLECDEQGLLVRWLNRAATQIGSRDVYRGAVVCRDASALNQLIDIAPSEARDPTNAAFCRCAAESMRRRFDVTHALVVGAIPSTGNGHSTVNVGIATADETFVLEAQYGGHPDVRGPRLLKTVLNHLRKHLMKT